MSPAAVDAASLEPEETLEPHDAGCADEATVDEVDGTADTEVVDDPPDPHPVTTAAATKIAEVIRIHRR